MNNNSLSSVYLFEANTIIPTMYAENKTHVNDFWFENNLKSIDAGNYWVVVENLKTLKKPSHVILRA